MKPKTDAEKYNERHPETKEVAVIETDNSPATIMLAAIEKGLDLEKVEKAMERQERWEANEAKKAFNQAMADFKTNPPEIEKDKKVSYQAKGGTTSYSHASLANAAKKIGKALSAHGLSATWKTDQATGNVTVTCTITHAKGHSESTSLTAGPDESGSKNSIQAIGSTISYLERYTILALVGLATSDMDTDGRPEDVEYVNEKQLSSIVDMINDCGADETRFLKHLGFESLDKIPKKSFVVAMKELKDKKAAQKKAEENQAPEPGSDG